MELSDLILYGPAAIIGFFGIYWVWGQYKEGGDGINPVATKFPKIFKIVSTGLPLLLLFGWLARIIGNWIASGS